MHPTYQGVLKKRRDDLNLQFKLFKQSHKAIEDESFFAQFKSMFLFLPVHPPENAEELIQNSFAALLDLAAQDTSLKLKRSVQALLIWQKVIPLCPELFTRHSASLLSSLANAVIFLTQKDGVRLQIFIQQMTRLAPSCDDIKSLQNAGVVAAWTSGLASQRKTALNYLATLPDPICKALFPHSQFSGPELSELWTKNPWIDHSQVSPVKQGPAKQSPTKQSPTKQSLAQPSLAKKKSAETCCITGGFSGFGGYVLQVPHVEVYEEDFLVSDGIKHWQLSADIFGAIWSRSKLVAKENPIGSTLIEGFEKISSFAENGHTIAVTMPSSLRVYLIASSR